MKKMILLFLCMMLSGCVSLSRQEELYLRHLEAQGVTIDKPVGNFDKPASAITAGALNILPGFGNFYLGLGNAAESTQITYGFINLLLWPLSIVWSIPQASLDATALNKREMIYYYQFDKYGKKELKKAGLTLE